MIRVIRSELIKIRTTNTWWLMGLGVVAFTALALLVNLLNAHFGDLAHHEVGQAANSDGDAVTRSQAEEDARYAQAHSAVGLAKIAANVYTSGQFFGVMLIMLLGAIVVTNEYFHQTATATFLTSPHRTTVITAKLVSAALLGVGAWLVTTVLSLITGAIFFNMENVTNSLGRSEVAEAVLLNLAAFVVWAVLGVGLGVLIRSQVGSVVTGTVVYLIGFVATSLIFNLVHSFLIKEDWVLTSQVIMPAVASMVMTTPDGEAFPHAPDQWVGAAVLIGYGLVFGTIGTLLTRRRDIS